MKTLNCRLCPLVCPLLCPWAPAFPHGGEASRRAGQETGASRSPASLAAPRLRPSSPRTSDPSQWSLLGHSAGRAAEPAPACRQSSQRNGLAFRGRLARTRPHPRVPAPAGLPMGKLMGKVMGKPINFMIFIHFVMKSRFAPWQWANSGMEFGVLKRS